MKKNLLAITGIFFPHNETITHITFKHLCNLNYNIDVISFKGSIDKTIKKHLNNNKNIVINYIDFDWKKIFINKQNLNIFNIFKYLLIFKKKCLKIIKEKDYSVLYSNSVPNYSHYFAYLIKRKLGSEVEWYASFTDPICNNPYIDEMKNKKGIFARINYYLNKYIYYRKKYQKLPLKYADKLIFLSEELRDFIVGSNEVLLKKSIVIPLTYVEEWDSYKKLINVPSKFNEEKIKFIHFGNIYGLRKIDLFLDAIFSMKNELISKKIEFHQYGDIDKRTMNNLKKYSLDGLFFVHNKVNYDCCVNLLKNDADVLLIFDTILEDNKVQPFLPSKVLDYLLVNKPIFSITSKKSPLYTMLNDKHICVMYNIDSIVNGIKKQIKHVKSVDNNYCQFENKKVIRDTLGQYLDIIE